MENGHRNPGFTMIYPFKLVISIVILLYQSVTPLVLTAARLRAQPRVAEKWWAAEILVLLSGTLERAQAEGGRLYGAISNGYNSWGPRGRFRVQLVNITTMTMVYGSYNHG